MVADSGNGASGRSARGASPCCGRTRRLVDQPDAAMPGQQVPVSRIAIDVCHERVEPDDLRRELRMDRARRPPGVKGSAPGQEINSEVGADARGGRLLDLDVGSARASSGSNHATPAPAPAGPAIAPLAGRYLGHQRSNALTGAGGTSSRTCRRHQPRPGPAASRPREAARRSASPHAAKRLDRRRRRLLWLTGHRAEAGRYAYGLTLRSHHPWPGRSSIGPSAWRPTSGRT